MDFSYLQNAWRHIDFSQATRPLILEAVVGASIGFMIGILVRILRKQPLAGVIVDGLLGAVGFVGGVIGSLLVPYQENTVTSRAGDMIIRTTTRRFQHPYQVAFVLAIFAPVFWEMLRYLRSRRATVSK